MSTPRKDGLLLEVVDLAKTVARGLQAIDAKKLTQLIGDGNLLEICNEPKVG